MITLDFSLAAALYSLSIVALFLILWLAAKIQKDRKLSLEQRFIWFCSICAYTYINTKEEEISLCPRCGSYNKKA